jgi:hypothetical protein
MQENPLVERIFASGLEVQETSDGISNWRGKIQLARPAERDAMTDSEPDAARSAGRT